VKKQAFCYSFTYAKLNKTSFTKLNCLKRSSENDMHLNHHSPRPPCFHNLGFCLEESFFY
jgi:hypothetical protein